MTTFSTAMTHLEKNITQIVPVSGAVLSEILGCFEEHHLKKGSALLKKKQTCHSYYYVDQGALKIHYSHNKQEIISWIALEDHFFTAYESYVCSTPSNHGITALEDSRIFIISKEKMDFLSEKYPIWKDFLQKNLEYVILKLQHILQDQQTKTLSEIYSKLASRKDVLNRIKLKDISSLMGTSPYTLSRVRKQKK